VIVRQGDTSASVALEQLALELPAAGAAPAPPLLSFHMLRSGNRSVYGNLSTTYTPPGAQPLEVGQINGVAVYVPNALRTAKLPPRPPWPLRRKASPTCCCWRCAWTAACWPTR